MSNTDLLLIKADYESWLADRGEELRFPFTHYCAEQILKSCDATDEDISYGITDGPNDGGVDALYLIVNRNQFVRDDTDVQCTSSEARLIVIQTKGGEHDGFRRLDVEQFVSFADDWLAIDKDAKALTQFNARLLEIRDTFKRKFISNVGWARSLSIEFYYACKGDGARPDAKALASADKAIARVKREFNSATVEFNWVNAQALLAMIQKRASKQRVLKWAVSPLQVQEGAIGFVSLPDYYKFISDDDGEILEHIFEANVRGYRQDTPVNRRILDTLRSRESGTNFWLLNNGITIIATKASSAGLSLALEDPQVVNGLQTSRQIHKHFRDGIAQDETRWVMVRVISNPDEFTADAIIRATNSQNKMGPESLRATDLIHHQIEAYFKAHDIYYDRRKGYYKDKRKPISRIVSIPELAKAVVAIVLRRPDDARARISKYSTEDAAYKSVFGEEREGEVVGALEPQTYLVCVGIAAWCERYLWLYAEPELERGDILNLKYYVSMAVAVALKACPPYADKAMDFADIQKISPQVAKECTDMVRQIYTGLGGNDAAAKGPAMLSQLLVEMRLDAEQS